MHRQFPGDASTCSRMKIKSKPFDSISIPRVSCSHCRTRAALTEITVGLTDWIESDTTMTGGKLHHQYEPDSLRVVAGGRWLDERTFEMTWQFVETAFRDKVVCRFDGDSVTIDRRRQCEFRRNVSSDVARRRVSART